MGKNEQEQSELEKTELVKQEGEKIGFAPGSSKQKTGAEGLPPLPNGGSNVRPSKVSVFAGDHASGAAGKGKASAAQQAVDSSLKRKRGLFNKDLRLMMYGFGDDPDPMPETVHLMEDILIDYITDLVHKSQNVASRRGKLTTEDVMFLVRKDSRKFARVKELLAMNEELKRARKAFDLDEEKLATEF